AISIPRTFISCFIGLASCGSMGSPIFLNSLWLIEVDPHRGGSISLRPNDTRWLYCRSYGIPPHWWEACNPASNGGTMTTVEFITALFCQVADQMPDIPKHP